MVSCAHASICGSTEKADGLFSYVRTVDTNPSSVAHKDSSIIEENAKMNQNVVSHKDSSSILEDCEYEPKRRLP